MDTLKNLNIAGKNYSLCAKTVTDNSPTPTTPSPIESELTIAFGISSDWTRRASLMRPIDYNSRIMRNSSKTPSVGEMIRFGLSWSGMNALFCRNSIMNLFTTSVPSSELKRFKLLYNNCNIDLVKMSSRLTNLHNILSTTTTSYVPGHAPGTRLPILQVLYSKYTPIQYQTMSTGNVINQCLISGNYSSLDMPTLVYLMRNWSVHGGVLGSNFRSVPRFNLYIDTINEALSDINLEISKELLTKL